MQIHYYTIPLSTPQSNFSDSYASSAIRSIILPYLLHSDTKSSTSILQSVLCTFLSYSVFQVQCQQTIGCTVRYTVYFLAKSTVNLTKFVPCLTTCPHFNSIHILYSHTASYIFCNICTFTMGVTNIPRVVAFSSDYLTASEVRLWLVTLEPFKPAHTSCQIHDRPSGTGTGFSRSSFSFPLLIITPPLLHIFL
jgi:hypothetical protein